MPTLNIHNPHAPRSALVIGGGIIGQSIALRLQSRGISTILVDPAAARPASWGNAGHIAVEQVDPLASWATIRSFPRRLFLRGGALGLPPGDVRAWLPFALRLVLASGPRRFSAGRTALTGLLGKAIPAWRALLALASASDLLKEDGHFVAWESEATARDGARRWKAADTGTATVRDADADELARLRALGTAPLAGAVRFSGSGQISDLGDLAERMTAAFRAAGGSVSVGSVFQLNPAEDGVTALLADGSALHADIAVVAGGARSAALMRPHGFTVPLIAERGYHIQSADTDWPADMPPVVYEDRSMIVTRFRSGLRAASFVEFGRFESKPDTRKWARLRQHVTALGLSFTMPGREWIGARPTLPDYLPAIGRSRRHPRLLYAFGHQHLGLTLAAITAEAIAALATGDTPPVDLAPFDLARFGERQ
jgi:D-amino-acid dehydrogenase